GFGGRLRKMKRIAELVANPAFGSELNIVRDPKSKDDGSDVTAFRSRTRDWFQAAVESGNAPSSRANADYADPQVLAAAKRFQAELHAAGLTGTGYPSEFGGLNLPPYYEGVL